MKAKSLVCFIVNTSKRNDVLILPVAIKVILDAMDLMMRIDAADNEDDDDEGGSGK